MNYSAIRCVVLRCVAALLTLLIFSQASTATAGQCEGINIQINNTSKSRFFCPSDPSVVSTIDGSIYLSNANRCNRLCSGGPAIVIRDTITAEPVPNLAWRANFMAGEYSNRDAYTSIRLKFLDTPASNTCAGFGLGEAFINHLFGSEQSGEATLTIMVSENQIQTGNFEVQGYAIPLYKISKTQGQGCSVTRHVNDDLQIARVLASRGKNLRILTAFVRTSGNTILSNIDNVAELGILGTVLNGTMQNYASIISNVIGPDGIESIKNTNLVDERSISIFPTNSNLNKEAIEIGVQYQGVELLSFLVYQDPDISSEGELAGISSLQAALSAARVVVEQSGTLSPTPVSLTSMLADERMNMLGSLSGSSDMGLFRRTCSEMDTIFTTFGFSNRAKNKIFALAMREHTNPVEFDSAQGRNVCIRNNDRPRYQSIYLEGVSETPNEDIQANDLSSRDCKKSAEWINTFVSVAHNQISNNADSMISRNILLPGENLFARNGENFRLALLRVADELSNSRSSCYYSVQDYGNPEENSEGCAYVFHTVGSDQRSIWSRVVIESNPLDGSVSIPSAVLDVSLSDTLDINLALNHQKALCISRVRNSTQ